MRDDVIAVVSGRAHFQKFRCASAPLPRASGARIPQIVNRHLKGLQAPTPVLIFQGFFAHFEQAENPSMWERRGRVENRLNLLMCTSR